MRHHAHYEQFLAVLAWHWIAECHGPGCHLYRSRSGLRKQALFFRERPDVALGPEDEKLAVGRPPSTARSGRIMPVGQELMEILTIDGNFPKCTLAKNRTANPESDHAAIG